MMAVVLTLLFSPVILTALVCRLTYEAFRAGWGFGRHLVHEAFS